jgi:hypothetical protein
MQITAWQREKGSSCELTPGDTWMSATPRNEFCLNCKQDFIRDCRETLGSHPGATPFVFPRPVQAARGKAWMEGDMVRLLGSGQGFEGYINVTERRESARGAA